MLQEDGALLAVVNEKRMAERTAVFIPTFAEANR
jgi:hypothetical protein